MTEREARASEARSLTTNSFAAIACRRNLGRGRAEIQGMYEERRIRWIGMGGESQMGHQLVHLVIAREIDGVQALDSALSRQLDQMPHEQSGQPLGLPMIIHGDRDLGTTARVCAEACYPNLVFLACLG